MTSTNKLNEVRIIPIIIFLSSSFLIIFTYMLLSDIPLISSLLKDYLISGNSFFFPTLPTINVFWFLPKKFQILSITIGQCIDLIIILNLTCYVESLIYHYIKWTILNKDPEGFSYYYFSYNKRNSEMCEGFELLQDLNLNLFREHLSISSVNYKLDRKTDPIYALEGKKKYRSYLGHKSKASRPFKLTLNSYNNYHFIFCNYYLLEHFCTTCSNISYSHPDIIYFADFLEQEGGKDILKIGLMDFLKKNTKLLRI